MGIVIYNIICFNDYMGVSGSREELEKLNREGKKSNQIISYFPYDKHDCKCQVRIMGLKNQFSIMTSKDIEEYKKKGNFHCDRGLGYKEYKIYCNSCDSLVGIVRAKDNTLTDFYDLHYVCESRVVKVEVGKIGKKKIYEDKAEWFGALAINLSPIDGKIGFECSCGSDTRDFRANTTMKEKEKRDRIRVIEGKREFHKKNFFRSELSS